MTKAPPEIIAALRGVIDPETGRDLVAMGMIYDAGFDSGTAHVVMTTTTRGCPLSGLLRMGVEAALLAVPGVSTAEVSLTWDPPWTPDLMEPPG